MSKRGYLCYTREPPFPLTIGRRDQRREITIYADMREPAWELAYEVHDEEGGDRLNRKALREAIRTAKEQKLVFVAHSVPYITRDLVLLERFHRYMNTNGRADYVVVTGPRWDSLTPEGRQLHDWLRKMIAVRRTIQVRKHRLKYVLRDEPQPYLGGTPPFGWILDHEHRMCIPDAREQAVLKTMLRLRDEGRTYEDIAQWLNDQGRMPRMGIWYRQQIQNLCRRYARIDKSSTTGLEP